MQKRTVVRKKRVDDGNQNGGCSLQPAKDNRYFYIGKISACKEHKLTGGLKGIMILGRRRLDEGKIKKKANLYPLIYFRYQRL